MKFILKMRIQMKKVNFKQIKSEKIYNKITQKKRKKMEDFKTILLKSN